MFNNNRLNPDDANVSPIAVGAATASVVGAVSFAHKSLLNYSPTYAKNLYNFTENLENKSPGFIFKTASLSEMASAHIVSSVHIPHENLFVNSHTTPLAEHLKRLIGTDVNLAQAGGLTFNKLDKTGYLSLSTDPSVKVKFYKEGRLGTSSVRYGAPISTEPYEFVHTDNPLKDLWSNFQALRSGQKPKGLGTSFKVQGLVGQEGEVGYRSISMLPVLAERDGKPFSNFITKFHRIAFGLVERPQQNLFAEFGIGVKAGSYNKILHIPFLEKNGRGIINELLSKRVLPAYLIAGVALPYLDYKLHHLPSNTAVNAFQSVTLARAKATDETPGLRSITDTYARVIPGPQYGPVALPLGGMVAGALIHYGNVLRDKYPHQMAREAAFRIFAKGKDVEHGIAKADATFLKIFNKASPVAKGLVAGLALMIPFIPGMIGSRKSEGELQDIYSGNEPVPIRTGRWWDMGCEMPCNQQLTPSGIKTAEEVYNSKCEVMNGSGLPEQPTNWFKYEYSGDIYNIKVWGKHKDQGFTPNHELLVWRNDRIQDVRCDELKTSDFVLMPRLKSNPAELEINTAELLPHLLEKNGYLYRSQDNWSTHKKQQSGNSAIPVSLILDKELGKLFGHFLAEGNLNRRGLQGLHGVEHVGALDELEYLKSLKEIYERRFTCKASITKRPSNNSYRLRVSSGAIADLFHKLFYSLGDKGISPEVLKLIPDECRKGILEGWFYGDGSFYTRNKKILAGIIKTSRVEHAHLLTKLLSCFGVAALCSEEIVTYNENAKLECLKGKTYKTHYVKVALGGLLNLRSQDISFYKELRQLESNITCTTTSLRHIILDNYIGFQVRSISKEHYEGPVYDFTVESDSHYEVYGYVTHNSTPFSGSTIKEWRPHWSVLWKAQAEKASIYGSEEAYWAHHPLVSPVTAFKDPYWLEKQNYEDRPYPVTSPAFSNVPIIGPFLAATIGKLVKPVRRMHTDEWDGKSDYKLYSSLLEPRGGAVDSPFERDISVQLAERGYKSSPQTPIGNYRADFTLEGNGHKVVLEADSTTYHGKWNAAADAKRQAEIEAAGWDVIRVKSKSFFSDSSAAMAPVFSRLQALGIEPEKAGGNIQSGLVGLANPTPKDEFGLRDTIDREAYAFSDFMGLPGFIGRSVWAKLFPDQHKDVFLQSSRQIDSLQRRYYEREFGAGYFMSPEGRFAALGYTEPLRRFIQNEQNTQQANEIPNSLANVGWIPGADAYHNFKKGDQYSAIEDGYARLPGIGYSKIHPEVAGLDPNDYPDINKLSILSDIAPYSREYQAVKGRVAKSAQYNPDLEIEYSRILDRVRQTKDSALGTTNRIFSGRTDSVEGTIDSANQYGVSVKEFPGRTFKLSGLGMSAADMAAISIGENNNITREALDDEVQGKRQALGKYLQDALAPGTHVSITVPRGSIDSAEEINAVFRTSSDNINAELIDRGYARFDRRNAGPEARDLFGGMTQAFGTIGEELAFTGDEEVWNPLRYVPTPAHTKFWQNKDPLSDYLDKEVYGSRMRRWDKPLHDFLMPYVRGAVKRATGYVDIPGEVEEKRSLNTITDSLKYLRSKILADKVPGERSKYTNQGLRTFEGVDLFSESSYVASTLPRREAVYFTKFVKETDPEKRQTILASVSAPTAEALEAQWLKAKANIDLAEGKETGPVGQDGRILTKEGLEAYKNANTKLNYGDFSRSVEIAKAFTDKNYNIPDMNSDVFSPNLDYEDVKLKILQLEGYDAKDFNIFDDRSNTLWRKPYIDGAVRELTAGTNRTLEANRQIIESMLLASNNRDPKVTMTSSVSRTSSGNTKVDIERDDHDNLIQNMRRNPEMYN